MPTGELCLDDFQDVREVLVVQNPIDVVPAFWMLCPSFLGLLIFSLQFV